MYGRVLGGTTATAGTAAAVALPNTGSSETVVMVAASVLVGLVIWAVSYARFNA